MRENRVPVGSIVVRSLLPRAGPAGFGSLPDRSRRRSGCSSPQHFAQVEHRDPLEFGDQAEGPGDGARNQVEGDEENRSVAAPRRESRGEHRDGGDERTGGESGKEELRDVFPVSPQVRQRNSG